MRRLSSLAEAQVAGARWMSVADAAELLGTPVITLRRTLERNLRKHADGSIDVRLDGLLARKFGRQWRVWLAACWTEPCSASR